MYLLSILLLGQALCKGLNEQWLRNRYATKTFENKKDENTWLRREFYRKWVQLCSNATKLFFKNYIIALYPQVTRVCKSHECILCNGESSLPIK